MTGLTVRRLTASYRSHAVLDAVDLDVDPGTTTAILGPSGCGKTTLLRVIAGFHPADAGEVTIAGRPVTGPGLSVPPERRGIGYVAQEGALFPHLSVADNIGFGLPRRAADRKARIDELLTLVGLEPRLGARRPDQISGGQQQRVALARALAPRPSLVLLDEPFSALDAGLRVSTRTAVADALAAEGVTVLLVTHDQDEALSFADQVVVMDAGRVLQRGRPEDVYAAPADRVTAAFVGDLVTLVGHGLGDTVDTPLGTLPTVGAALGAVEVALRPEQVVLAPASASTARPTGTVRHRDYFGHDALVHVVLDDGTNVSARLGAGGTIPTVGDRVTLDVSGPVLTYPL